MNDKITIHLLTTGGTIEKSYDELDGTLDNRASIIRDKVIANLRLPYTEVKFHPILAKDSLYMTDDDRQLILNYLKKLLLSREPIVVLHGTDTMDLTVKSCHTELKNLSVPIIFTGAMRPIGFEDTDAIQNVTEALMATKIVGPGVYVSFHGNLFKAPNIRKNKTNGTFEEF